VTVVEMAIVVMVVFMFLMGIIEFSRILMTRVMWDNAPARGWRWFRLTR
jgi:Flp pilus assembly protein TadG